MALQKNHNIAGITTPNAYHKISYVSGNKNSINVDVVISKDAAAAAVSDHMGSFSFSLVYANMDHTDGASDKNYLKQAYEYMKSNSFADLVGGNHDYSSAVDV